MIQEANISPGVASSLAAGQMGRAVLAVGPAPGGGEARAHAVSAEGHVRIGGAGFARLQESKEAVQRQAIETREHLSRIDELQQLMRGMRDNLNAIVKSYPPFPQGSEERERYLNLVAGLRKQMEALIFPPREHINPSGPLLPEPMQWMPPALDGASGDADIAMTAREIETRIETASGFGEGLRQQWIAMAQPGSEAAAAALSVEAGLGLVAAGRGIGGGMRTA